ncbi:MAG: AlpA family phage regulatory protein [Mycobacteriales bacterium]
MNDESTPASASSIGPIPPLLRLPAVLEATGLGRSTVYKMIAEHQFPAPVKLAKRAVAWRDDDVRRWTSGRPSTAAAQVSRGPGR